jgi:hypothetical protein
VLCPSHLPRSALSCAAGRASQDFSSFLSGAQKFEFGQTKLGSRLDADFKEECSRGPATKIARILHGSEMLCSASSGRMNGRKYLLLLTKKCGRPWGRIIAVSKIKDLASGEGQFHVFSTFFRDGGLRTFARRM